MGGKIKAMVNQFPTVSIGSNIQPITRTVLRVRLMIVADFVWNDKVHGTVHEPWWIWVEDPDNDHIYHSEYFMLMRDQVFFHGIVFSFKAHFYKPCWIITTYFYFIVVFISLINLVIFLNKVEKTR